MELVVLILGALAVWAVLAVIESRRKRHSENTRLLEQALKNPALDRATLETLTFQLTGQKPLRNAPPPRGGFLAVVLAFGWITLFTGIGLLISGEFGHDRDLSMAGLIVGLIGFGFVSYPFALRELESRRAPQ
ncbi:MAG: hypothetical protein KDE27_02305 [Planctomycetes bacterium]|nr:hypothetical protein [Planctomycetota bacterium]